jgi:hypothetical protein
MYYDLLLLVYYLGIIGACWESDETCQQVVVIGHDASWNTPELMPLDIDSILRPTKENKQHMLINIGVKHAKKPTL